MSEGKIRRVPVKFLVMAAERACELPRGSLLRPNRHRGTVRARQAAMWLAVRLEGHSLARAGKDIGGRDHTTVIHAVRVIDRLRASDQGFCDRIEAIHREAKRLHARSIDLGRLEVSPTKPVERPSLLPVHVPPVKEKAARPLIVKQSATGSRWAEEAMNAPFSRQWYAIQNARFAAAMVLAGGVA